ncbi:MAG: lanthionine synthetase LanC family protein [Isosphaerales bacterium]
MTDIHPDLVTAVDAVEILSPARYAILGEIRDVSPEVLEEADAPPLLSALAADLYAQLYVRPSAASAARAVERLVQLDFLGALSRANTGRGTWEPGWTIRQPAENGQIAVGRQELIFWVATTNLRSAVGRIMPGESCRVRVPKELRHLIHGFYFALGDGEEDDIGKRGVGGGGPQIRYYWHLTPEIAAPFVAAATSLLNAAAVPFRLKVLSDPNAYTRADAGVLYVGHRYALRLGNTIDRIHESVASGLLPEVPLFTRRLADGLALAEEPATAVSFGQHRCKLVASALWRSFVQGDPHRSARVATLAAVLQQQGLDPQHPYLGPGSAIDDLDPLVRDFPVRLISAAAKREGATFTKPVGEGYRTPLDMAVIIGQTLCRAAHWDRAGRLCNWTGRSSQEVTQGTYTPTSAALGPDLYSGSAGVALFLAQLHAQTGNAECRRTALGAIARSLRQTHRRPTDLASPLSFFCGHLGVAYAAHRVGALTGEAGLDDQAGVILDRLGGEIEKPHPLDLIGGNAGAIPALLGISRATGRSREFDRAIMLGEELCRAADRQDGVWTWNPAVATGPGTAAVPLTGMGHGAAGIALALLELHVATGRAEFLEAAIGAFAYEDFLYNSDVCNWPDLRGIDTPGQPPRPLTYARAWCQGAPGIALARLRAAALDPPRAETHLAMARAAIGTTLRAIDKNLALPSCDTSLCHGLAGLMEVVLIGSRLLSNPSCHDRAVAVARAMIDRHAIVGDWPSGLASGGPNPSLMLGLAGTGYSLLRLHNQESVPSVLLLSL